MINVGQSLAIIAVTAAVTALIRFLPFLIFHKGTPKPILYLGEVLPFAVMGMLVVYCYKGISFTAFPYGLPELISAGAVVVFMHLWRRNTLSSILTGTITYMLLINLVFI